MAATNDRRSFADFPFELREQIYRFSLVWDEPLHFQPGGKVPAFEGKRPLSLLKTCKWISREAASLFYGENSFTFLDYELLPVLIFLQNVGHVKASSIRHMGIGPLLLHGEYDFRTWTSDAKDLNSLAPDLKIFEISFTDSTWNSRKRDVVTDAKLLLEFVTKLEKVVQVEGKPHNLSKLYSWKFVTEKYTLADKETWVDLNAETTAEDTEFGRLEHPTIQSESMAPDTAVSHAIKR